MGQVWREPGDQARLAVDPEASKNRGGDRRSEEAGSNGNLPNGLQPDRASENGVSPRTQRYLDHLARDRPDLLAEVEAGRL